MCECIYWYVLPVWGLSTPHISQPWGLLPASRLSLEWWAFACSWPTSLWWMGHPASQSESQLAGRGSLDSGEWSLEPTGYTNNRYHVINTLHLKYTHKWMHREYICSLLKNLKKAVLTGHWPGSTLHCIKMYNINTRAWLAFSLTFSKEEGDTTEKQTRKTSVWG